MKAGSSDFDPRASCFQKMDRTGRKECEFALRAVNEVWAACHGGALTSLAGPRKLRQPVGVGSAYPIPSRAPWGGSTQGGFSAGET